MLCDWDQGKGGKLQTKDQTKICIMNQEYTACNSREYHPMGEKRLEFLIIGDFKDHSLSQYCNQTIFAFSLC